MKAKLFSKLPALIYILILATGGTPVTLYAQNNSNSKHMAELATFGGGCFWCTEAVFTRLKGVESVMPGYSGGTLKNPDYKAVCSGLTGHAEVIQITFNPEIISYKDLLKVFFSTHDPTTLNRQGADVGTQYRSVIFYHNQQQKEISEKIIADLNREGVWTQPIVTQLVPFEVFYPAEEYHQDYFEQNPNAGYCRMVIQPKVAKFEKVFGSMLR